MKLLLIDDDRNLCKVLAHQLRTSGYQVETVHSGREGLALFDRQPFDIVVTDIQMPDISGIEVLREIRRRNKQVIILIITAYGSVDNAIDACKLGADDYITKPFGKEQLLFILEKAVRLRKLQQENVQLRQEISRQYGREGLVFRSPIMQRLLDEVYRVAASEATVLITGESGTGKELIAKTIHYNSPRKDKPLVTVNCPSIPENLLESELFGHVKGAFTGATRDRKGKFELADGGSLFLDEVGDLKETLQAKLLRVLQESEIERVGESKPIKVDVRVIAATNRNLEEMVSQGRFREDLYYRLSVVPIEIPPLRERKEDIPVLVEFFSKRFAPDRDFRFSDEAMNLLLEHNWPGNVRELENFVERLLILTTGEQVLPEHILRLQKKKPSPPIRGDKDQDEDLSLHAAERRAITRALEKAGGNQSEAARLLKIPRHVLIYRMKKLGLTS